MIIYDDMFITLFNTSFPKIDVFSPWKFMYFPPENDQTSIFPQFSEYNPKRHKTDFQNALRRGVDFSKNKHPALLFSNLYFRMEMSMLTDLSKDYLKELDITLLGDIILILKHAKKVAEKQTQDRVLGDKDQVSFGYFKHNIKFLLGKDQV